MIQLQHFGPPLFHDIDFKRFWWKYHTKYRFNISYKYKCLLLKWVTNWLCNLLEFEKKWLPAPKNTVWLVWLKQINGIVERDYVCIYQN